LMPWDTWDDATMIHQFRLANGMTSRTELLMEFENIGREEATARLIEVAEDLARESRLFAEAQARIQGGLLSAYPAAVGPGVHHTPKSEGGDSDAV
jgi:hypothetical protein